MELPEYPDPVPVRLPDPGMRMRVQRSSRTFGRFGRQLLPSAFTQMLARSGDRAATARAVRMAFEEMGATYVKFGQLVASAPGVVGEEVAEEFRNLLDRGPAVPFEHTQRVIERELGKSIGELFSEIDPTPLAAASIAVVHRARLLDGTPVAVKVLRPGIGRVVATDLSLMLPAMRTVAEQGSDQAAILYNYLIGLRSQVSEELNLHNEAAAMDYFRPLFESFELDRVAVPKVYHDLTSRRVLTMEYFDGVPIDDLTAIEKLGFVPRDYVVELLRAWVLSGLLATVFHGDIHAGNLLVLPDGRLGMVDWGIVARLDPDTHDFMRSLVEATLGEDAAWKRMSRGVMSLQGDALQEGLGLNDDQIDTLVRAMLEPVLTLPVSQVSMATLFAGGDEMVRLATGESPPKRSLRERYQLNRRVADMNRRAIRNGFTESPFRRATFLAAKQLVYLERYARIYMPDRAILGDTDFLRRVIDRMPPRPAD